MSTPSSGGVDFIKELKMGPETPKKIVLLVVASFSFFNLSLFDLETLFHLFQV